MCQRGLAVGAVRVVQKVSDGTMERVRLRDESACVLVLAVPRTQSREPVEGEHGDLLVLVGSGEVMTT